MIKFFTAVLYEFLLHGFSAFKKPPKAPPVLDDETPPPELESTITDPTRVLNPFERHIMLSINSESVELAGSDEAMIEALGASLDSLGEEISRLVPESVISSTVARSDEGGVAIILGQLDWQVDNQTPLVYSICMDLLKDGFTYRTDTGTFVIVAKVVR